jgi:Protein of unknown function (DUF2510)
VTTAFSPTGRRPEDGAPPYTGIMYYSHGGWIAIAIFGGTFALRYLLSPRRRGRGPGYGNSFTRTGRPGTRVAPPVDPDVTAAPPRVSPASTHSTSSGLAPGWFTDPLVRHEQRYWSGTGWTEHVTDHGVPGIDPPDQGQHPADG